MELEEAIDVLKNKICDYVIPSYCNDCVNKPDCLDDCNYILAIYTVTQELDRLQKENEDFRRLEKDLNYSVSVIRENSKLRYELAHSVSCDKISEKIEYLKLNCGNSFVIDALEDLLKEE